MSVDINSLRGRIKDIKDYADELADALDELWDAYIDAAEECDELRERVEE